MVFLHFVLSMIVFTSLTWSSQQTIIAPSPFLDEPWLEFKEKYNKVYKDEEEIERRLVWEDNLDYILQHNDEYERSLHSFTLGLNEFADMTHGEFIQTMTGFHLVRQGKSENVKDAWEGTAELPDSVDWKAKGCVGPVGNQDVCGSCWAFTATGSLEGIYCKQIGKLIVLSVQQLMDCSSKQGNHGCEGGMMDFSFTYVKEVGGLVPAKDYPYVSKEDKCKFNKTMKTLQVVTDSGYKDLQHGDEMALQAAVANVGPISVAVDATQRSFQLYKSGVYDEPKCNNKNVQHSLVIVGYGTQNGKQFYNAKNSWGTTWGDEGYIMLSRNKNNQCGVANIASYPTGVRAST